MPQSFSDRLQEAVAACFTGLWIHTHEPDEALCEINRLGQSQSWRWATWDIDKGLQLPGAAAASQASDPVAAVRALPALAVPNGTFLLLLPNFHRFLTSPEVIQALAHQIQEGKERRTFIVILAPVVQIPIELEKLFLVVDHDLPDRTQLEAIARGVATEPGDLPDGEALQHILDAAAGLTRYEAENAFALSLTRHGTVRPDVLWELKAQMLKKQNLLTLYRGNTSFADLGGLEALKSFCKRALTAGRKVTARGLLLLGVPGTGKSAFAQALGAESGRPTLRLDMGTLLAGLVGQSESNLRQALRLAEAMSPSILFVDELEKALSGLGSSGDSGVATRLFGYLLSWLADHTADVFFLGTCNDVRQLPPEFSRAERLDAVFFLDIPPRADQERIWAHYRKFFEIAEGQALPDDRQWTGAEIRACCRLAALLDVSLKEAARNVVPVAVTAAEAIGTLRRWAHGRCLDANSPGLYQAREAEQKSRTRTVTRNPSSN